ncbi:3' terminal RNA ribose 2'-O-methyltransferase Hen1 [Marinitenerispora sediminis]|uniref:Small RNA 2'-O-methyltransferase n=1 Tax=Marinitenerispora sediminis TaxID=1931232 RepID=A0A368T513_9ACTN|nr:3' terminal RNA ribose 2'-O-methyltransferase Hen1 [Marinitenerispora sediminis]RCV49901.1 3' terminal RNA ribose 2'-O-methyltransferase Hen1 [Marinitenerispora sediminis]RCV54198.1 3' terminal RNA ribose 2'-O-methyltransferase Hen1 [Marinitenerispora sediminis]RCV58354.1 3' terminal RNA ribose 2'-O-methyltransferase Hen1 [Marinitenerispora sediminis]
MLLTISTTHRPATDLGFLLHKHPDRVQAFPQSYGTAHVCYPEVGEERCTAALVLDVEPQALLRSRGAGRSPDFALAQYVNDRPYAASSLFAVALGDVFRSALKGKCAARPELAAAAIPLTLRLPAVACRGGPAEVRRMFEPLGWEVEATAVPLDPGLPGWGDSRYVDLTLSGEFRLADALSHLYVLLPVLDGAKHYWVSGAEVDKLLRAGEGWLAGHPERGVIARRYLARRQRLVRDAIERLAEVDDAATGGAPGSDADPVVEEPEDREGSASLAEQRAGAVLAVLRAEQARRVIDLGCGSGKLLARLLDEPRFERVTGVDVSAAAVEWARRRLRVDGMPPQRAERLGLFVGSALYRDRRFAGHDAAVLMEVVEHVDPSRLPALAAVVFGHAAPRTVVVTTPNVEYNIRYAGLAAGRLRHADHRFEWTRAEFAAWAGAVAERYGYQVRYLPVGDADPELGPPTQMGVFTR